MSPPHAAAPGGQPGAGVIVDDDTPSLRGSADISADLTRPYAAAWRLYWDAGWRGVLALPPRRKIPPPEGYTGHAGIDPSFADCTVWAGEGEPPHNIGLRLPATVVGIDRDCWDGKTGDQSIAAKEAQWGPLPKTYRSTSRGFDTGNGIWLYRVPEGTVLSEKPLADVEIIQRHHRYVVCWPSIHPNGGRYEWLDERTGQKVLVPDLATIPELSAAWVEGLRTEAKTYEKATINGEDVAALIDAMPTGDACDHVRRAAAKVFDADGRHDGYRDAMLAVVGAGRQGCPGAAATLKRMRRTFLADVTAPDQDAAHRRTVAKAKAEWADALHGALEIVVAAGPQLGHCVDDLSAWPGLDAGEEHSPPEPEDEPDPAEVAELRRKKAVLRVADELRLREDARALIAREKAAAAFQPPPVVILPDLIAATAAERVVWRWEGLAEVGDRFLIEAKAKTGKTTFLGNVVRSVVTGDPLLGHFTTTPIPEASRLLYLDTELGPRRLARWLGDVLPDAHRDRVAVWSIAGRAGALDVRDDDIRARMVAQVTEALEGHPAGFLVVDVASAWTAPLGIEENDNAAVRAFCEALHTFALDLGVDGLALAHHAGHTGERSRGASAWRDWPDVYATLTRSDQEDDPARYLSALGRGVDVPESRLTFDPATRLLSMAGSVGLNRRSAAREIVAGGYVPTVVEIVTGTPGLTTRALRKAVAEALREDDVTVKAAAVGDAVTKAAEGGLIRNTGNDRRADWQPVGEGETGPEPPDPTLGHTEDTVESAPDPVSPPCPTRVPDRVPDTEDTPVSRVPAPIYRRGHTDSTQDDLFDDVADLFDDLDDGPF